MGLSVEGRVSQAGRRLSSWGQVGKQSSLRRAALQEPWAMSPGDGSSSPGRAPASDQAVHKGALWALGEEGDAPGPPPAPEDPLRSRVPRETPLGGVP